MSLARGVALGGARKKPHALTIYVPNGMENRGVLVGRCLTPTDTQGGVCGATFFKGQEEAWQRHVGECARRNMASIVALSPRERNRGTPFDPENWNPDAEEHLRKIGRRMIGEGRLEMRPSEKIANE